MCWPLDGCVRDDKRVNAVAKRQVANIADGGFIEIRRYFEEERYLGRLERFVEGVHRKAASYGIPFDPQLYRLDLATAAFTAGVKNGSRRGLASVSAELTLYARSDKPNSAGRFAWLSEVIDLKPNFMGLGLNLNALLKKAWGRKKQNKT